MKLPKRLYVDISLILLILTLNSVSPNLLTLNICHVVQGAEKTVTSKRIYSVRDYGAVGNGKTLDTVAIQKAIDLCSQAGGGTVWFDKGTYLSGTLFMKSGVRLWLEHDATILASTQKEDYRIVEHSNRDYVYPKEVTPPQSSYLIYADGVEKIAIEGPGTIDGSGVSFWDKPQSGTYRVWTPKAWRPRALICVVRSRYLKFHDVTLRNSPTYTIWTIACEDLSFHNLTIQNPTYGPNTDGLDLDCCRRAVISDCNITGGDDAIALKSDSGMFGPNEFPCENISVSNCVLCAGPACGVRIGYEGDSIIRNCSFSNLTIYDSEMGLDLVSILPAAKLTIKHGSRIENITFTGITMKNVGNALHFWLDNKVPEDKPLLYIRNISITNLVAECKRCCYIGGYPGQNIESIYLSDIHLIPTGSSPEQAPATALPDWFAYLPYIFYCSMVDRIHINNLTIDWSKAGTGWRYGLFFHKTKIANLSAISSFGTPKAKPQAMLGFDASKGRLWNSAIDDSYPLLDGKNGSDIFLSGCDTANHPQPILLDKTSKTR